jgi:RNA polymerase sigma-70 factor (ECF subfamily)
MSWNRDLEEHFRRIYDEVFPIVLRVVWRVTNDQEVAEELAHDAFIKLYERIDHFPDADQAKYWLIRVAKNHALNHVKRRQRERRAYERVLAQPVTPPPTGEDQLIRGETSVEVQEALQKLPEKLRVILIMKEYTELNYKEIAKALGITEANVKVRVFRARQKLAEILGVGGSS